MVISLFLGYTMLIIHLSVSALVWNPIRGKRGFEAFSRQIQQILVSRKGHAQGIDSILFDLLVSWFVVGVNFFDKRLIFLVFVFVLV